MLILLLLLLSGCAVGGSAVCHGQVAKGESETMTVGGGVIYAEGGECKEGGVR